MPTLTVKNIPEDLYELLKQHAQYNHRSLNREIIACIEQAVASHRLDPETLLATARQLREKTSKYVVSDVEFDQMKNTGRP